MQEFWLALTHVQGLGPVRLRYLRSQFESIEAVWYAQPTILRQLDLPSSVIEHFLHLRQTMQPADLLQAVHQLGAWVLTLDDDSYPPLLKEITDAPTVLYGMGDLLPSDQKAVAVVGTRRASNYGKEMTRQLVAALIAQEVTIVSGLAHGIDIQAHQTALEAGGRTVAVLGSGIDIIYPSDHRHWVKPILESGAIITEYPPKTDPLPPHFLVRNRIISGLSLGVVVVEAPEKSGSINTAQCAGEQGREVFAVPGNANVANSRGANRLIQDGAKLVLTADDILKELQLAHRHATVRQTVRAVVPANLLETQVLACLALEPLHVDDLARQCQLHIREINATLALMELKGLVYQTSPMMYQRVE